MALNDAQLSQFMAAQQQEQREQVLYQFNAGTLTQSGTTVTADSRKGKVVLSMEDDGLLRFQWRLRHKDENEQLHYIFPAGATWTRVSACKDGAVFLLKFRENNLRQFFWSQEPRGTDSKKKEAEILRRVAALITNPPAFGAPVLKDEVAPADEDEAMTDVASVSVISSASGETATVQGTGHSAGNPVSEAHRGVVAHAVAPATPAPASSPAPTSASAASAAAPLNTNTLLSTLNAMAQQLQARQAEQESRHGVEDVLDAERVQTILDVDSALVESLVEYLPEGQRSPDALRAQLRSPQLQQTMSRLTSILNSAQFGQLMASLSLPVGQNTGLGVDAFLAAILAQAEKQKEEQNK